jgi:WD40 repeat protein
VDLRDLTDGTRVTGELSIFAFHPFGRSAFLYTPPDALVKWDMQEEERQVQFHVPFELGLSDLSCSPDGRLLAGVTPNQGLYLWDAETGEPESRFDLPRVYAPRVAWSPDASVLAIGGGRGVFLWDVYGRRILDRLALSGELVSMAFHPDGTRLLTCCGAMQAWPTRGGADLGELTFPGAELSSFALSADGRTMALGGRDGVVRLLPAEVVWAE